MPAGPMYSEEEAVAILKAHLQSKEARGWFGQSCFEVIETTSSDDRWSGQYDRQAYRRDITAKDINALFDNPDYEATWSLYERTGTIVPTGNEGINQRC